MDDDLTPLTDAEYELNRVISAIDDLEMDILTNCARGRSAGLASYALKNQPFWVGRVTGQEISGAEESMAACLRRRTAPIADEVPRASVGTSAHRRVMTARHATPFGDKPWLWSSTSPHRRHCPRRMGPVQPGPGDEFPPTWIPRRREW
jgi:hypothetical protein